jgi:tRNA (adenine22-N1)-methyltransferase
MKALLVLGVPAAEVEGRGGGGARALPPRLAAVLSLVPSVGPVADIGSGHGALALALVERGQRVVATERTPRTLARLRAEVARRARAAGAEPPRALQTRLGDGMAPLARGEVDTVVLAGMGARSIVRIVEGAAWLPPLLVLQPIQEPELVGDWIGERGWRATAIESGQRRRTYLAWAVEVGRG